MKKSILIIPSVILSIVMGISLSSFSTASVGSNDVTMDMSVLQKADTTVYDVVDEIPSFPGGNGAMMSYLSKNLRLPKGVAYGDFQIFFVVERDGSLSNINVKADTLAIKAAFRLIKKMPRWTPGKLKGKVVRCRYFLPMHVRLQ